MMQTILDAQKSTEMALDVRDCTNRMATPPLYKG
jgi:hypothetical protein